MLTKQHSDELCQKLSLAPGLPRRQLTFASISRLFTIYFSGSVCLYCTALSLAYLVRASEGRAGLGTGTGTGREEKFGVEGQVGSVYLNVAFHVDLVLILSMRHGGFGSSWNAERKERKGGDKKKEVGGRDTINFPAHEVLSEFI